MRASELAVRADFDREVGVMRCHTSERACLCTEDQKGLKASVRKKVRCEEESCVVIGSCTPRRDLGNQVTFCY